MSPLPRKLRKVVGRHEPAQPDAGEPDADIDALSPADRTIVVSALPFTMTGVARLQALVDSVRYVVARDVPGAFAECGVWRGGSVVAMVLTLQELGVHDRDVYLYDTFEGMTAPTEADTSARERPALEQWQEACAQDGEERPWGWAFGADVYDKDSVRETVLATGYPAERVHVVAGPVEETIPGTAPERLALLRLDTDWYESTRHELEHLYPRLIDGGVLILDDYGHWEGARRAVDEYFAQHAAPLLLNRIDYTGRVAVKH